jgi:hypothetical protein
MKKGDIIFIFLYTSLIIALIINVSLQHINNVKLKSFNNDQQFVYYSYCIMGNEMSVKYNLLPVGCNYNFTFINNPIYIDYINYVCQKYRKRNFSLNFSKYNVTLSNSEYITCNNDAYSYDCKVDIFKQSLCNVNFPLYNSSITKFNNNPNLYYNIYSNYLNNLNKNKTFRSINIAILILFILNIFIQLFYILLTERI